MCPPPRHPPDITAERLNAIASELDAAISEAEELHDSVNSSIMHSEAGNEVDDAARRVLPARDPAHDHDKGGEGD